MTQKSYFLFSTNSGVLAVKLTWYNKSRAMLYCLILLNILFGSFLYLLARGCVPSTSLLDKVVPVGALVHGAATSVIVSSFW